MTTVSPTSLVQYYPTSETDSSQNMAYANSYDVYTLVTNTETQEQTLVGPETVFTAVAPNIDNLTIQNVNEFQIQLSGTVVEESEDITVYAAVFAPHGTEYDATQIKEFFTSSEFVHNNFTKLKTNNKNIDFYFDNYHTNIFFHDEIRSIVSNVSDYKVIVYVKDNTHTEYDEFYESRNVNVNYVEDQETPLIDSVNIVPRDLSANISFITSDNENPIDVRAVVFHNATTVSDTDARRFLRHANIDGFGYSQDNVSNVSTVFSDISLDKALTMSYVSTEYNVAFADSTLKLNGYNSPLIHVFRNQVYTFKVTGALQFYLSTEQDITGTALGGTPDIAYITTDGHEFNTVTEGLSNIDYVRYKVSAGAPSTLYYGLWDNGSVGGVITVLDANDSTSFPTVPTGTTHTTTNCSCTHATRPGERTATSWVPCIA